jgi:hypothetical protein
MGDNMENSATNQSVTINTIQNALDMEDFISANNLLNQYKGSLNDIIVHNLAAAAFMSSYIKSGVHDFSITKSPLVISLSNFVDKTTMKQLVTYSSDQQSSDLTLKLAALNCYLDNKSNPQFNANNNCLKQVLHFTFPSSPSTDTISILTSHIKCEPSLQCSMIPKYLPSLYNLNSIIAKIMDSAAKSCAKDNCNIVFTADDNYSVKDGTHPEPSEKGYYDEGINVFICGKSDEPFNIFAHELTHYAMKSLYDNNANPYPATAARPFGAQPSSALIKFLANELNFKMADKDIDALLQNPATTYDQTYIKNILVSLKAWYPANQIDSELVARYSEWASFNMTETDLNIYMQPVESYLTSYIVPDINSYLLS